MAHLIITVNKLNRRSSPIANVADKSNIIDTVSRGFSFESVDETSNVAGTWYRDAQNRYYWAGGVAAEVWAAWSSPSYRETNSQTAVKIPSPCEKCHRHNRSKERDASEPARRRPMSVLPSTVRAGGQKRSSTSSSLLAQSALACSGSRA